MSKIHVLQAEERAATGTGEARAIRRNAMVPAIIYGSGKPQVAVSLPRKELTLEYRKQGFLSHIFEINLGKAKYKVLPKAIQLHPVTDEIEHMDFMHVNQNDKVKVIVSLHIENEEKCPGVKHGGVLNVARHDLEVYCLPDNIPESITIDVSELNIGQNIHLGDIKLPNGVETKLAADTTIAAVLGAAKEVEESSEEAATEAASAEK